MAIEILSDGQRVVAATAENRMDMTFSLSPNNWRVVSQLFVATNTRVKRVAALESDSYNVALRMIVRALSLVIDRYAADDHRGNIFSDQHD